jgi:DNA (cytosine-5)-methyltransferase 1
MNSKIDVIDLFCGCGGLAAGFASADDGRPFRILGGVDLDPNACATFAAELRAPALQLDARSLLEPETWSRALSEMQPRGSGPLVVVGGPPCQGFSAHRKKDIRVDERNNLVSVFFSLALRLTPEFIVMENVPEIFDDKHWASTSATIAAVERRGYRVRARIHNLADFGVPQARFRALIIARRCGRAFNFPDVQETAHRTVRDAIAHLPEIRAGERSPSDPMHVAPAHTPRILELIDSVPRDGGSRKEANLSLLPACHDSVDGFRDVYGRLYWDKPAISITAKSSTPSCGRFLHPEQNRNISVREAALLQGFPSSFNFCGPMVQLYRQIGNAVSPKFAHAVAEKIAEEIRTPTAEVHDMDQDIYAAQGRSFTSSIAGRKRRTALDGCRRKPTAIDLFCGAGGLSLGLLQAGYDVMYAMDNDPDATTTYSYNVGPALRTSAFDLEVPKLLASLGLEPGECDLLVGGPPCQGFSQHRRGADQDERNELVQWFAEAICQIAPKVFLLENVPYIAAKRGKETLYRFMETVQAAGYHIHTAIIDAANYGVPQHRERFIAVGFSNGLGRGYSIPLFGEAAPATVRDAIGALPAPREREPHEDFANHIASAISELNRLRISYVPEGGGWKDIPEDLRLDCHKRHRGHGHLDVFGRLSWEGRAQTITAHCDSFSRGRYAHPNEDRPLTGRELASLQSFPSWFRFLADKKSVARLIGNAVPPAVARTLAISIKEELLVNGQLRVPLRRVA